MDQQQIADVRAFNRFYTRQIGLLDDHYQGSRFSLPEGRLLYEISTRGHTTGAELARSLGVDPAYVSRILRRFLGDDLVALTPSATDRRSNAVALTREGDAAYAELDAASSASVAGLLGPIDPMRREALLAAMRTIRAILGDDSAAAATVVLRPHRIGELGWLIHRQGLLYNQQYGWNGEFEALIAGIYSEYEAAPATPPRNLWVAERNGMIAGSVFCMPSDGLEGSAQLRMLYVEPEARGSASPHAGRPMRRLRPRRRLRAHAALDAFDPAGSPPPLRRGRLRDRRDARTAASARTSSARSGSCAFSSPGRRRRRWAAARRPRGR